MSGNYRCGSRLNFASPVRQTPEDSAAPRLAPPPARYRPRTAAIRNGGGALTPR